MANSLAGKCHDNLRTCGNQLLPGKEQKLVKILADER